MPAAICVADPQPCAVDEREDEREGVGREREETEHHLCPGYKTFFHHVSLPMQEMTALLRAGRAPADLMAAYAAQDSRRGRNDPCSCGSGRKWKRCHGAEPAR